jgi:diadenosine tetraphosphate (Ap4A) HIT family hydrolase
MAAPVDCVLCAQQLETPVLRETRHWRIALNRNQNLLGKLIVALRRHEEAVTGLSSDEWTDLRDQIGWATGRLRAAFAPDHFNYAFLGNQDRHVHLHVIPRYAGGRLVAGEEFEDADYPDHYRPGVDRRLRSDVIATLATTLSGEG